MTEIIFTIPKDGEVEIEVNGVKGDSCLLVTKQVSALLGETVSFQKTEEFYAQTEDDEYEANQLFGRA